MNQLLNKPLTVICLATALFASNACNKNDDKKEEENPPPVVVEKDEWKAFGTDQKTVGGGKWSFLVAGKVYFGGDADKIQVYNLTTAKWETDIDLPAGFEKRTKCGTAVANNKVYVGGGFYGGQHFLDWWEFDPAATTPWKKLADCPIAQYEGEAFIHNGTLYSGLSLGKINNQSVQNRFYRYTIAGDNWNQDAVATNSKCGSLGFGFLLNNIFYYGGGYEETANDLQVSLKCHKFNPSNGIAEGIADFPESFLSDEGAITFTANGKGYVLMGGSAPFQYDPATNKWKKLKDAPDEGGQNMMSYVFQSGEKVYGFLRNGKVFEYIYK